MQRLVLIFLLILAGCCPMQDSGSSWGKKQVNQLSQLVPQSSGAGGVLEVGAEERQNETLQEGETAYLQCRIKNLRNRYVPYLHTSWGLL